jgi:chemosensory pili system protein ChpA (sensor histidine kinase/response regulator)
MVAWRRREHEPDKSLTAARKELVHSYMDAEEAEARRREVEQRERQGRTREQARLMTADVSIPVAGSAKRRDDGAGREDDEVARQVAAAVADAREEARREAEEETARQVAGAVEEALREAKDETARQVAEAVAQARQEAAEAAARHGAAIAEPVPEQPRAPELEEPAPPVAATLDEARPKAPENTVMEPAREEARQDTGDETAGGVLGAAEQPAGRSTAGLPLFERIEAATQPDEAAARVDWTRELLRAKKNARNG